MEEFTKENVIKNIATDQKEILYNIMQLYNNGEPFDCDITASTLKFYEQKAGDKYNVPEPRLLFDVYPQQEKIGKITPFEKLPLKDGSLHSIVVDLPFVISPKTCPSMSNDNPDSCMIAKRFASFYPAQELFDTIYWNLKECYRVLDEGGIVVWKMQSTVSGGRQIWASPFSFMVAEKLGFYVIDEFVLDTSKIKKQQHARKYTSQFFVFKKGDKNSKFNLFNIMEKCENGVYEGKVYELK